MLMILCVFICCISVPRVCVKSFVVDSTNANSYATVSDGSYDVTNDVMKGSEAQYQATGETVTLTITPVGDTIELKGFGFIVSDVISMTIIVQKSSKLPCTLVK